MIPPKNQREVLKEIDARNATAKAELRSSLKEMTIQIDGGSIPVNEVAGDDSVVNSLTSLHNHVSRPAGTVLFVDDEQANRFAIKYSLDENFRVLTANGGKEALEILAREPVAVVVTDQRMPGMTGVELCKAIYKKYPAIALVVVSAYFDQADFMDAKNEAHIRYVLSKPWNVERLTELLQDIMVPSSSGVAAG